MTKLEKAFKDLTYSSVASAVLVELYGDKSMRSTVLVKAIENKVPCSRTLIYQTLTELRNKELIFLPTDRKRMKFYALTEKGRELVEEEVNRNAIELKEIAKSIPRPYVTALELLADEIYGDLPESSQSPSVRMLIRRKLEKSVGDLKKEIL